MIFDQSMNKRLSDFHNHFSADQSESWKFQLLQNNNKEFRTRHTWTKKEQKSVVKFVKMEFYANSHQLQKPPKLPKHDVDPKIDEDMEETEDEQIEVQFRSEKGDTSFPAFSVPKSVTNDKLKLLLQAFKKSCPVSAVRIDFFAFAAALL